MPTFSPGGYVEPGSYVQIQNQSAPNIQPGARVAAFTGTGITIKNILRETLSLTRTTPSTAFIGTLSNIPIVNLLADGSGRYTVTDSAGKVFYGGIGSGADFTYVTSTGVVTWELSPTNGFPEGVTNSNLTATVYVNYTVEKNTLDYAPQFCEDLKSVIDAYGPVQNLDGTTTNTLSLAAQIYFANGGSQCYCAQCAPITATVTPSDATGSLLLTTALTGLANNDRLMFANTGGTLPTGLNSYTIYYVINLAHPGSYTFNVSLTSGGAAIAWSDNGTGTTSLITQDNNNQSAHETAINALETVTTYCVVPLYEGDAATHAGLISTLKEHVTDMSTTVERKNRIGLLGGLVSTDSATDPSTSADTHITNIQACSYFRLGYVVPANATLALQYAEATVSGSYIAAAVAGVVCNPSYTAGEPISGKSLTGFDSIADVYTRYQKNRMASYGGMIIENQNGNFVIRHALSTDTSTVISSELKITRIEDSVAQTVSSALQAMFINTRNTGASTLSAISSATALILNQIVSIQDIVSYANLKVVQDPIDPRQIDVSFAIQPSFDVSWILITFGISL